MAMIGGETPTPEELPVGYKRRVVVKFRPDVRLSYTTEAENQFATTASRQWNQLSAAHPGIALVPYFSTLPEHTLRSLAQARAPQSATVPPSFTQYFAIECPTEVDPESVVRTVASWPNVEFAYVEAGPTPPPVNPVDDPRNTDQHYEDAAPTGIDARWAWGQADGSGVRLVDMEQGWTLNHEDLVAGGISLISGVNKAYTGHGTAVLGEILMVDNTLGGVGIAPFATARVVSQWRDANTYNTAEAILSAAAVMQSGDVLLLEAQTTSPTMPRFLPVEIEQATFDAIQYATSNGIIVVEAGGNGSNDLDTYQDSNGKFILNRNSNDFRDSGAIMVGAASSSTPHMRSDFSNYGSRIDCFGWGDSIYTTGDGWTGDSTTAYTTDFGGTSGASPIVAGSALILQSWLVKRGSRYSPPTMRAVLSSRALNTASADPSNDRIGVMPNLQQIISSRRVSWWWTSGLSWAWLIIVGGLMITPGGVICIACGPGEPGYVGGTVIRVLGVVSAGLGLTALINHARGRSAGMTR